MKLLSEYSIYLIIAPDGKLSVGRSENGGRSIHTDVSVSPSGVRAMAEDWLFILNDDYTDDSIDMRMLRKALKKGVVSELHTGRDD